MFVDKWEKENRNFRKQDVRETTYSSTVVGGEKLFQIQTYGAEGSTGSAKQTIQFDKQRALELIEILKKSSICKVETVKSGNSTQWSVLDHQRLEQLHYEQICQHLPSQLLRQ